jgi:ELWxxDGT repeat protein
MSVRRFKPTTEALEDRSLLSATLLHDVNPITGDAFGLAFSGALPQVISINNVAYFAADDGVHGLELWRSDGTAAGTRMVKDLRTTNNNFIGSPGPGGTINGSNPMRLTAVGSTLYFTADDGVHGVELWKTDGTEAGTVLVKDFVAPAFPVYPGIPSGPTDLVNVNGTLFFRVDDGEHGFELWKTDGTAAGTMLVKDIFPAFGGSSSYDYLPLSVGVRVAAVGSTLYFTADDGQHGVELWKTDGTEAGTVLVEDIFPAGVAAGWPSSSPMWLTAYNGKLYFVADDGQHGAELWKSDGTAAGTSLVRDIAGDAFLPTLGSTPADLAVVGGKLYFTASTTFTGRGLWKTDGTTAGTTLVQEFTLTGAYGPGTATLTGVGNSLYFLASDGVHGTQLYKSNGTAAGTVALKDDLLGSVSGPSPVPYPFAPSLANVGGTLYFSAYDAANGFELWKSNGTTAGTVLVEDLFPGAEGSDPVALTNVGGKLFFVADDATRGVELWRSDGTTAGTLVIDDLNAATEDGAIGEMEEVGNTVYFVGSDPEHGAELWKTDGTTAGTTRVADINPAAGAGSFPHHLTEYRGRLFFVADDGVHGTSLWTTDGTAAGTVLVKDVNPDVTAPFSPIPGFVAYYQNFTVVGDTLYFTVDDGSHGNALWKTDGTPAGTVLVKDVAPSAVGPLPPATVTGAGVIYGLVGVGNTLYFAADDGVHGTELWRSDGTEAGTVLVRDIYAGSTAPFMPPPPPGIPPFLPLPAVPNSAVPQPLASVNGTLYFLAEDGTHGIELWRTDGTAAGTVLVKDINPGPGPLFPFVGAPIPTSGVNFGGALYFIATDLLGGSALWRSDGTAAGTTVVRSFRGPFGAHSLTVVNGTLYFTADDGVHGAELWQSDGTPEGTVLLRDVYPGAVPSPVPGAPSPANFSNPHALTSSHGVLYFFADDGAHGTELWQSDGTPEGTVLAVDVNPGPAGALSFPGSTPLLGAWSGVYLQADDGTHGVELRRHVGNEEGNRPPIPHAGGPYVIPAGAGVTLDASGTTDPDGDRLSFSWDINGDNVYNDAVGVRPTLTAEQLRSLSGSFFGNLLVTDGHGHESFISVGLVVQDAPVRTPNERFVDRVYHDLLHRDADASGLAHWSGALDRGMGRADLVRAVEGSLEYRTNVVRDLYAALLGREADASGLGTFTAFLGAGGTATQATVFIAASPEYFARHGGTHAGFLAAAYRDLLGRDMDAGGAAVFGLALASGVARLQVLTLIVTSPEYQQNSVQGYYRTYLAREADAGGFGAFVTAMLHGMRREEVVALMVGSDEYYGRAG